MLLIDNMAHGPDTPKLLRALQEAQTRRGLYIEGLRITSLPTLPDNLLQLDCDNTQITQLPPLPTSLTYLSCSDTQITQLPPLPKSLEYLQCDNTQVTQLPSLPDSLGYLHCDNTPITQLPELPHSLLELHCNNTKITEFPPLPDDIMLIVASGLPLERLPLLPSDFIGRESFALTLEDNPKRNPLYDEALEAFQEGSDIGDTSKYNDAVRKVDRIEELKRKTKQEGREAGIAALNSTKLGQKLPEDVIRKVSEYGGRKKRKTRKSKKSNKRKTIRK